MKQWAASLRNNTYALYLAARDPRVPVLAKVLIGLVVGYALSPIDLIPDFIPVLGYLDDFLLLPIGIWLAIRLVPRQVWKECQLSAAQQAAEMPASRRAAAVIITLWLLAALVFTFWLWRFVTGIRGT